MGEETLEVKKFVGAVKVSHCTSNFILVRFIWIISYSCYMIHYLNKDAFDAPLFDEHCILFILFSSVTTLSLSWYTYMQLIYFYLILTSLLKHERSSINQSFNTRIIFQYSINIYNRSFEDPKKIKEELLTTRYQLNY